MNEKINMFLATEYEYRRGLAHKLIDDGVIDFCLTAVDPYTVLPAQDERIVTVNTLPSGDDEYFKVCDINEFPTISKDLLEAMLPYESMALKIGVRRSYSRPISEYEDEKRKYLQHLRYWNYMYDKYGINFILFACTPHSQGMYVAYCLARVKKIPLLILERTGFFEHRRIWGDSIENIGQSIEIRYNELTKKKIKDYPFDEDVDKDYHKFLESIENPNYIIDRKETIGSLNRMFYMKHYIPRVKEFYREYIRYNVRAFLKPNTRIDLLNREVWFRLRKKQLRSFRYYLRKQIINRVEYNKLAEVPDFSKKYICFFLQQYPEVAVLPRAGVFAEQYNSIQILARAAEKVGCYVYVREHPGESSRAKDVYSEIKTIKNVVLIKSNSSATELIRRSVAVATQTGTCIVEAGLLGKPAIVFGNGNYYKGCPSAFEMFDEEQGARLIQSFIDGVKIEYEDMKRYLYAIQLESIEEVGYDEEFRRLYDYNYVMKPFPLDSRVDLIKEFIKYHLYNKDIIE